MKNREEVSKWFMGLMNDKGRKKKRRGGGVDLTRVISL